MRKLASIQKILSLDPIPGADAIEVASVLGWKCVVKKGELNVGDLCVYIEVDSILPDREEFEFMRPRGMRVRTVKLRGQVSQGLAISMGILDGVKNMIPTEHGELYEIPWEEDDEVTDVLGITKYEPPVSASLGGDTKGNFPEFIPKTDEDRIQSFPDILTKYAGTECEVREKLDGSSATYYLKDGVFGVCSRNLELSDTPDNTFWKMARKWNIEARLREAGGSVAIQGELIGPGIQKNKYKLDDHEVRFFNVFDIDSQRHLGVSEMSELLASMGLPQAPLVGHARLGEMDVDGLVEMATFKSLLNNQTVAEGVVIRSLSGVSEVFQTPTGPKVVDRGRVSFKVISPTFLLKNEE